MIPSHPTLYSNSCQQNTCRKPPPKAPPRRSVTTLSPSQLERKRANDREAQRLIRRRAKDHIQVLEKQVEDLTLENMQLKRRLSVTSGDQDLNQVVDQQQNNEDVYDDEEDPEWDETQLRDSTLHHEPRHQGETVPAARKRPLTKEEPPPMASRSPPSNKFVPPPLHVYPGGLESAIDGMTSTPGIFPNPNWASLYSTPGMGPVNPMDASPFQSPPTTPNCDSRAAAYSRAPGLTTAASPSGRPPPNFAAASRGGFQGKLQPEYPSDPYTRRDESRW